MFVRLVGDDRLRLRFGSVRHAEDEFVVGPSRWKVFQFVRACHFGQPWPSGRRDRRTIGGHTDVGDRSDEVVRALVLLSTRRRWLLELPVGAEPEAQLTHVDVRWLDLVRRPTADIGSLERRETARSGSHNGSAGQRRIEAGGLGRADHVGGVVRIVHPQRDAQVGVRPEAVRDHTSRSLGGEYEVEPERSPALGDVDHAVDELGHLLGQRRELVDHDHQARRRVRVVRSLEREQVLGLLGVQNVLAVAEFGVQRRQRTLDEVRAEVGDDADAVRQLDALGERRATLVVDEQERHPRRAVHRRHAEHPRLQELALARSGRSADQRVRTLRAQIEMEWTSAGLADERAEGVVALGLRRGRIEGQRVVLTPGFDDGRRFVGDIRSGK